MADFVTVGIDGTNLSSIGAFQDLFALVRVRVEELFRTRDQSPLMPKVRLLKPGGGSLLLADGRRLATDGALEFGQGHDLVHMSSFAFEGLEALENRLSEAASVCAWLRWQYNSGALISAGGTALTLLAAAGLLGSVAVPVPRPLVSFFRQRYPRVQIDERNPIVEQGRFILGRGLGMEVAMVGRAVERVTSRPTGRWLGPIIGLDEMAADFDSTDPLVVQAQIWLEQRFAEDVKITDLAKALSVSHQTLIRHFERQLNTTPRHYVQQQRVAAAKHLLRRTNRTIAEIANMVGYNDLRSFRAVFEQHTGMSASRYRAAGGKEQPRNMIAQG